MKIEPSTEVEEVQILPTPKREDFEIIDVDAEVPVQDENENDELEKKKKDMKVRKGSIVKSWKHIIFFYNLTMKQK